MGLTGDDQEIVVEVIRAGVTPHEVDGDATVIEVLNTADAIVETDRTTYVVEVIREYTHPFEVTKGAALVNVVQPGGTVVNVGAGPTLPENPYEGQIWIKT
jgi:hypothetical protein